MNPETTSTDFGEIPFDQFVKYMDTYAGVLGFAGNAYDRAFMYNLPAMVRHFPTLTSPILSFAKVRGYQAVGESTDSFVYENKDALLDQIAKLPEMNIPNRGDSYPVGDSPAQIGMLVHDMNNIIAGHMFDEVDTKNLENSRLTASVLSVVSSCVSLGKSANHDVFSAARYLYEEVTNAYDEYVGMQLNAPTLLYEVKTLLYELTGRTPVIQEVSISDLINQFLGENSFFDKNTACPVTTHFSVDDDLPPVMADPGIICRSLRNLLKDVATHGAEYKGNIPAHISATLTPENVVMLSLANKGTIDDAGMAAIGKTTYSRQKQDADERIHGWGKLSVSNMYGRMYEAVGVGADYIERAFNNQWQRVRIVLDNADHDGLKWSMPLIPAQ